MSIGDSSKETVPTDQNIEQSTQDISGTPLYFAVSPVKLVIMSICTMGLYEIHWFYKNWALIRERRNLNIMPAMRAIFAFFFCYGLFRKVQVSAIDLTLKKLISPGLLATGWAVVTLLHKLPDPYWLVSYFAVTFLLPVQTVVNDINNSVAPGHDRNETFTSWNKFGIALGSLFFVFILIGAFFPEE